LTHLSSLKSLPSGTTSKETRLQPPFNDTLDINPAEDTIDKDDPPPKSPWKRRVPSRHIAPQTRPIPAKSASHFLRFGHTKPMTGFSTIAPFLMTGFAENKKAVRPLPMGPNRVDLSPSFRRRREKPPCQGRVTMDKWRA
jgi:hypothetical protein